MLLGGLLLLVSACSGIFATPSQGSGGPPADSTAPTTSVRTPLVSPTAPFAAPTITLQVSGGCPALDWDRLVGTRANVDKVQEVSCGALEGPGSFDALIDVRYYTADSRLDFYVYDTLFGAPARRFGVQGLLNGDAQISFVGTLITAEEGPQDIIKGARDLFKEYQWNGSAFAQVSFPGIYPDVTRYQAEHDQAAVNAELAALPAGQAGTQIQDAWKLAPASLVSRLAQVIFHWQLSDFSVVVPPKARQSLAYTVTVVNQGSGGGGLCRAGAPPE